MHSSAQESNPGASNEQGPVSLVLTHIPPSASPTSTIVSLRLQATADSHPEAIFTDPRREHGWRVALSHQEGGVWTAEIKLPQEPTVLRYHFELADGTILRELRQIEGVEKAIYGVWEERDYRIACYDPNGTPPSWVPGQVMYQIFPDRFAQGNPSNMHNGPSEFNGRPVIYNEWSDLPEHPPKSRDFYGGDLRGVIEKLPYIRDLGATVIYFTPIFASPTNHRYDAMDYRQIDPRLGTEADLRELIERATKMGIRVQLDGVFNHCSHESVYFKAARADRLSPYYRWFNFTAWPDKWEGWMGVRTMPEFVECPEVEEFFFGKGGIAHHWLAYGTAGWRTDVTPWLTDEYWRRFRRAVRREYPDAYLVAEDWGDATHRLVGDTFDATMNYRFGYSVLGFAGNKLTAWELDHRLETLRRDTPTPAFFTQMNLLGSHDTARILTVLGNRERVMLAAALQLAYPGVPMVYYGDEAGIEGGYAEASRVAYPWGHEDNELLEFYKRAINARRASKALSLGDVRTVWVDEEGGYGFLRLYQNERVLALFNNGAAPLEARITLQDALPADLPDGSYSDLLGRLAPAQVSGGALTAEVPPYGAGWFNL